MKSIWEFIVVLLVSITSSSYTMSDKSGFDAGMGIGLSGPSISVPRLGTQLEEQQAEYEAGQSSLEQLALELAQNVLSFLPAPQIQNVALVSRQCRIQAQFSITHLTITLEDITEEKLKDVKCRFPNIRSLQVIGRGITPKQIELLAQKFPLTESLDLAGKGVTLEGIIALNYFKHLKALDLSWNNLGDDAIKLLVEAPFAEQLESLKLDGGNTGITEVGIAALAQCKGFKALKELYLEWGYYMDEKIKEQVYDAILKYFPKAPFAGQLLLKLRGLGVTNIGFSRLTAAGVAKKVIEAYWQK